MSYEVTGTITKIKETNKVSDNFKKRSFWIETDETYPQMLELEFVQDKVDLIDKFAEGETVTVSFNIRGRKWEPANGEARVFNTLQAWKISKGTPKNQKDEESKDGLPF